MAISTDVARLLLARSGGYCANPECPAPDLFPKVDDEHVPTVGEMAHVIAESPKGPRGDDPMPLSERDEYDNLVLLCPRCHTLVDKMKLTGRYSADLMREWKRRIEEKVRMAVGIPRFASREELNDEIVALLERNHGIFVAFGPESSYADDPLSDAPALWRKLVREELLPNNRRILELLDANRNHLTADERNVVEAFRAHAFGFAENHISGERRRDVPRFPTKMNELFGS